MLFDDLVVKVLLAYDKDRSELRLVRESRSVMDIEVVKRGLAVLDISNELKRGVIEPKISTPARRICDGLLTMHGVHARATSDADISPLESVMSLDIALQSDTKSMVNRKSNIVVIYL